MPVWRMKRTRALGATARGWRTLILCLLVGACAAPRGDGDGVAMTGERPGIVPHAFAVYDDANRLIRSPIEELRAELARRGCDPGGDCSGDRLPISDVYVLAHGWNYKLDESTQLWEGYRHSFERELEQLRKKDPTFSPFLIFVTWSSVTRPISDAVSSISPYDVPGPLRFATGWLDAILFHLPSNWGETQDAFTIALGRWNRRVFDASADLCRSEYSSALLRADSEAANQALSGYDVPVSVLLDELVRIKRSLVRPFRVHAVGHSYGAKIASLATFDATARLLLRDPAPPECASTPDGAPEDAARDTLIDSLVLIQPAIKVQEMYDTLQLKPSAPSSGMLESLERSVSPLTSDRDFIDFRRLAEAIPRKAIVFSRHDSANGWVFGLSQLVLDYEAIFRTRR